METVQTSPMEIPSQTRTTVRPESTTTTTSAQPASNQGQTNLSAAGSKIGPGLSSSIMPNSALSFGPAVILQPCLVILFEFFTIAERLVAQSISREWMRIARLRRFWSNYQYAFPGGYWESCTRNYDRRTPDPNWLCESLGGLAIKVLDLIRPGTFSQMLRFNHITQLEILDGGYFESQRTTITVEEGRIALKQLHLITLTCVDLRDSLCMDILFDTADELAATASTIRSPNDESPLQSFKGAIFSWQATLERFKMTCTEIVNRPPPTQPTSLFTSMSRTTWPALTDYSLEHPLGTLSFDADSLTGLRRFFTHSCLPSLQILQFRVNPAESEESISAAIGSVLREAIQQDFNHLEQLDVTISSCDLREGEMISARTVTQLTGAPPLPFCFKSLIRISVTEMFTMKWLTAISACESLTHLSIHETIHTDVTQFNFFQAIHSLPIGTLDLPYFLASTAGDKKLKPSKDGAGGTLIREYFSQMVHLTQLNLVHFTVSLPYPRNEWLFHLDYFPRLEALSCTYEFNNNGILIEEKHAGKYSPKMLAAVTRMPHLTSLTLKGFGSKDISECNRLWLERINSVSNNDAPPIPLHTLHLLQMYLNAEAPPQMLQLVEQLRHFTRLTDLSIQVVSDQIPPPEPGSGSTMTSFYRDLDQCRSLRSLRILGCDGGYHCIDDATLEYWCDGREHEDVDSLIEMDERCGYWSRMIDGSATKFRSLELLEFKNSSIEKHSIAALYALPRLRQLYWSGLRIHSHLYKWIAEKNRHLAGLESKDQELAPIINLASEMSEVHDRPPMHLGYLLPVKIDRLARLQ